MLFFNAKQLWEESEGLESRGQGGRWCKRSKRGSQYLLTTHARCVTSVCTVVQVANVYSSLEWPAQALEAEESVF